MRKDFSRVPCQIDQKLKFLRSQVDFASFHQNRASWHIDPKISDLDYRGLSLLWHLRSARCRTYSCEQFVNAEWLRYVIVGAGIQRFHLNRFLTFHRQHDNWYSRLGSYVLAEFKTIPEGRGKRYAPGLRSDHFVLMSIARF